MDLNQMNNPDNNIDESSSGQKLFNELNYDCLVKVLMYIPVLERLEMEKVCQKWKEATELSWYNVKKVDFEELMVTFDKKEKLMKMIMMRCCQYLTHLTIIEEYLQYSWMCDILKNNCQNIIHFSIYINDIQTYPISNEDLVEIIMSMTKLKYLKVTMDFKDASNNCCNQILNISPNDIQEIHLIAVNIMIFRYTLNKVAPVLNKFNDLKCLAITGFCLTNATMKAILQNKNTLVKLDLTECKFPDGALSIFPSLKNLEHLILWRIGNLDLNKVISIAHNCLKLKHFKFMLSKDYYCPPIQIPYRIFRELKYLNLEHLEFSEIGMSGNHGENQIFDIANNWSQLKYLNVGGGRDFSVTDFQEIPKFKNLEFLDLSRASIHLQLFINITSDCLELKKLIMCFKDIPESALEKLTNLKKLEKLDFAGCDNLTGNLLPKISNNCKNLVDLDLQSCHNLTEASLIQVGKLQHLKILVLDNIVNVPNAMFNDFHKLKFVSCYNCPSVTDESIIKVLDNCPNLSTLFVCGTGITVRTLVHASNRQFVFKPFYIHVDVSVKNDFIKNTSMSSPYLTINNKKY